MNRKNNLTTKETFALAIQNHQKKNFENCRKSLQRNIKDKS